MNTKPVCEMCDGEGEFRVWFDDEHWEYQSCAACTPAKCACPHCAMGLPNHCTGPDAEKRHAEWTIAYSRACADLVLAMATGSVSTAAAREQFIAEVKKLAATKDAK